MSRQRINAPQRISAPSSAAKPALSCNQSEGVAQLVYDLGKAIHPPNTSRQMRMGTGTFIRLRPEIRARPPAFLDELTRIMWRSGLGRSILPWQRAEGSTYSIFSATGCGIAGPFSIAVVARRALTGLLAMEHPMISVDTALSGNCRHV